MSCNKLLLCVVLSAAAFPVFAQDAGWVVAAEKFDEKNIPAFYSQYSGAIPLLLLSEISRTVSRNILPGEKKTRDLRVLSSTRLKLIRERAAMVLERDRILLSSDQELLKKRKLRDAENRIGDKEAEIAASGDEVRSLLEADPETAGTVVPLSLWKSGTGLFVRPSGTGLASALSAEGISTLLSGTVEDIGGYLFVTARIETGIADIPVPAVSDAAAYEDLGPLVASLASRLLGDIANREPVTLVLDVKPESARVFIDGRLHADNTLPAVVFAGEHTIGATAPGHVAANRTAAFANAGRFSITINLEKEIEATVAFDTTVSGSDLFLRTRHFGRPPVTVTIPALPAVGEILSDEVRTFFVFDPDRLSGDDNDRMTVRPNKIATEERIEKTRSVLYWSLGALYISLPFSMLTYGISLDKYRAYQDGKLDQTEAVVNDINGWSRTAQATRYISIALGCNVLIQLARYLFAAEQATPQYAEPIRR